VKRAVKLQRHNRVIVEMVAEVARIDRHGNVKDKRVVKGLTMRNFHRFLARVGWTVDKWWDGCSNVGGVSCSLCRDPSSGAMLYVGYGTGQVRLGFGTSDVAPTRGDYVLGAEVDFFSATTGGETVKTATESEYTYAGAYVWTEGGTVREIGLFIFMRRDWGDPVDEWFLVDRAVLPTPLSVPAGESVTITYRVRVVIT